MIPVSAVRDEENPEASSEERCIQYSVKCPQNTNAAVCGLD
jgi:hypothetical protein